MGSRLYFDLPFLNEHVLVKGAGGRPHVDALIAAEKMAWAPSSDPMGIRLTVIRLAVGGFCQFVDSPLQPAFFFRTVGDANFHLSGRRTTKTESLRGVVPLFPPFGLSHER